MDRFEQLRAKRDVCRFQFKAVEVQYEEKCAPSPKAGSAFYQGKHGGYGWPMVCPEVVYRRYVHIPESGGENIERMSRRMFF